MPTTATPNVLTGPGYLFRAPLGSALPTFAVSGSQFTDAWPVAWVNLGATTDGSQFTNQITLSPIEVAEFYDAIKYETTARSSKIAFNLADYTLNNLSRALNGGTLTVVSGAGATQLSKLAPPPVGSETRCMIGWESVDSTVRMIGYQAINGATIQIDWKKAPNLASIPCEFNFEVPSGGDPYDFWTAGDVRYGS